MIFAHRDYARIRQRLTLFRFFMSPIVLAAVAFSPMAGWIDQIASISLEAPVWRAGVYFLSFFSILNFLELPLDFYSGYLIEKRFQLSNENVSQWAARWLKKFGLSLWIGFVLVLGLYALLVYGGLLWWLWAWAGFMAFSYGFGKLLPVIIIPLFYRFSRLEDSALRERIQRLVSRYRVRLEEVYAMDLSKTTKKANAAFMGFGRTRRVVLTDTLLSQFSADEIEAVVAHELGHCCNRDLWRQLANAALLSLITFWSISLIFPDLVSALGFSSIEDPRAMPLLFLIFSLFSMIFLPLQNTFSRYREKAADLFALEACRRPEAFISCMEKLGRMNLADPAPAAAYEWIFCDHPPIAKRVAFARDWARAA